MSKHLHKLGTICLLLKVVGNCSVYADEELDILVLSILNNDLQEIGLLTTDSILENIGRATDFTELQARSYLLKKLDHLDQNRRQNTETWRILGNAGGSIESHRTKRFLSEIIKRSRRILKSKKGRYSVRAVIELAAKEAGIMRYQGQDILTGITGSNWEDLEKMAPPKTLPDSLRLLVRVYNEEDGAVWPATRSFFATEDTEKILRTIRGLHRSLSPELVLSLSTSPRVEWVTGRARPDSDPDFQLTITIETFGVFRGAERGTLKAGFLCRYTFEHVASKKLYIEGSILVHSKYERFSGDKRPPPMGQMYKEWAEVIRKSIEDALEPL